MGTPVRPPHVKTKPMLIVPDGETALIVISDGCILNRDAVQVMGAGDFMVTILKEEPLVKEARKRKLHT